MQVHQQIRASAEITQITAFAVGDVYKRVESTYSGEASLKFGVITDVLNNGTDSAIIATEYSTEYAGLVTAQKVWNGLKPVEIFAAQPDEIRDHIAALREAGERKLREAQEAAAKAEEAFTRVLVLERQARTDGALSAPQVVVGQLAIPEESDEDGAVQA